MFNGEIEEIKNRREYEKAIKQIFEITKEKRFRVDAIGHRVVHGGSYFSRPVIIDEKVIKCIKDCIELAPLHNPPALLGIEACKQHFKNIPQVAVFDTAFHQSIPKHAHMYALPQEFYNNFKIRRYGFHGTSHKFVCLKAAEILKKDFRRLKIISCHLGNGASITAVKDGKSVDTSMGFTPLEGLVMGTRSGNIDPAIIHFLHGRGHSDEAIYRMLNEESGLLGLSGISSDVKVLNKSKNKNAKLALDVFCYRVKKYIGAYSAALGGADVILFTAGIGENAYYIREKILGGLEFLGINIDKATNKKNKTIISTKNSKVKVLVIHTDEDLMIVKGVNKVLKK